jgi:hypothetical protein
VLEGIVRGKCNIQQCMRTFSTLYLVIGSHTKSSLSFSRSTANMKSLYLVSGSGMHFAFVPNLEMLQRDREGMADELA